LYAKIVIEVQGSFMEIEPLDTKIAKKTEALPLDGLVNAWGD
jgi:hypothetical protein